ncbi:hypothetical protein ACKC5O_11950 [Aeromonas schubertii]|uniref:Uncharacterized protein n=1 Tax=Aeromonas schubertii TaxID=652 RepID=A0ABS7VEJ1_9GAMM|nr:hypothetical protein [Aeromonas schubertii]MBZ6067471.1 hypothetical protein [Aeromonas schubertii]MBZ6071737.1 hypothetical protein [Aeromonas schubertii]QCG48563.1 hypothetical protein E2P79_12600 [Aeromonas schubertii]
MANQDLIFSILPRAPATPGSEPISREVRAVGKKPRVAESTADPKERRKEQPPAGKPVKRVVNEVEEEASPPDDPPHQIDLFV